MLGLLPRLCSPHPHPSALASLSFCRHTSRFIITWCTFLPFALWVRLDQTPPRWWGLFSALPCMTAAPSSAARSTLCAGCRAAVLQAYTGWLTIAINAVITFLLVGTENIGIMIEQPMTVLPLATFASSCRHVAEAIAAESVVARRLAEASGMHCGLAAQGRPQEGVHVASNGHWPGVNGLG